MTYGQQGTLTRRINQAHNYRVHRTRSAECGYYYRRKVRQGRDGDAKHAKKYNDERSKWEKSITHHFFSKGTVSYGAGFTAQGRHTCKKGLHQMEESPTHSNALVHDNQRNYHQASIIWRWGCSRRYNGSMPLFANSRRLKMVCTQSSFLNGHRQRLVTGPPNRRLFARRQRQNPTAEKRNLLIGQTTLKVTHQWIYARTVHQVSREKAHILRWAFYLRWGVVARLKCATENIHKLKLPLISVYAFTRNQISWV